MREFDESKKRRPKPPGITLRITGKAVVLIASVAGSVVRWYKRRKEHRNDRDK